MKTIIAGTRSYGNQRVCGRKIALAHYKEFADKLQTVYKFAITEVISGCAPGTDTMAIDYAKQFHIPLVRMPADWNQYHKAAGIIRNVAMAKQADALVAFWDGQSSGTRHMIEIADEEQLFVTVYTIPQWRPAIKPKRRIILK